MKKQILLLLLGLPGMAYPMGNIRGLARPAYTAGVRSYMQPSVQQCRIPTQALPAINTLPVPQQRQLFGEVLVPAVAIPAAIYGGGWGLSRIYDYLRSHYLLYRGSLMQSNPGQYNPAKTESLVQYAERIGRPDTSFRIFGGPSSVGRYGQAETMMRLARVEQMFNAKKNIQLAHDDADKAIGEITDAVKYANEANPSSKNAVIPGEVRRALVYIEHNPDLRIQLGTDLNRNIDYYRKRLTEELGSYSPSAWSQEYYRKNLRNYEGIKHELNRL